MAVSIPIEADTRYRSAMAMLARQQQRTMGALVREAVDALYGSEIAERMVFFAPDVHQNPQIIKSNDKHRKAKAQP